MPDFYYMIVVTTADRDKADEVMRERLGFDEDYGFDYQLDWDAHFKPQEDQDA